MEFQTISHHQVTLQFQKLCDAAFVFAHECQKVFLGGLGREFKAELWGSWFSKGGLLDGLNDIDQVGRHPWGQQGLVDHLGMGIFAIGGDWLAGADIVVCHLGVELLSIGVDGFPKVREEVCHWGVEFWFIRADEGGVSSHWGEGCTLAKRSSSVTIEGDCLAGAGVVICHLGVGFLSIGVDSCPKFGVEVFYWGVDFWFIRADEGGIVSHWGVGCTLAKSSSLGGILAGNCLLMAILLGVNFSSVAIQIIPSNSKVMGVWDCCPC
jgi:hypothetical protein